MVGRTRNMSKRQKNMEYYILNTDRERGGERDGGRDRGSERVRWGESGEREGERD